MKIVGFKSMAGDMWNKVTNLVAPVSEDEFEDEVLEVEEQVTEQKTAATASETVVRQQAVGSSSAGVSAGISSGYANPAADAALRRQSMRVVGGTEAQAQEMRIQIYTPQNFDGVSAIADDLKSKRSAIVNYEQVELAEQRRICDFLNGVCYVQNGSVRRITSTMVLYVPDGVAIDEIKTVAAPQAQPQF